ncbi:unnamed protein product [Withania somnifera]
MIHFKLMWRVFSDFSQCIVNSCYFLPIVVGARAGNINGKISSKSYTCWCKVCDEGDVELWDMSSNFFFSESDVGKNIALASVQKLQEFNNVVVVSCLTTKLTKEKLSDFQVYLVVFCDFGPEFTVFDLDSEEPHTGIIASISNDNPALLTSVDDERLEFQDRDLVVFLEVQGMTELHDGKPGKIRSARPYSFTHDEDTTNFGPYKGGGVFTQVKQPKVLNFKTLREAIADPGNFLLSEFSKFDRPPVQYLAFQALDKFRSNLARLIFIATNLNESSGKVKLDDINPKLLQQFSHGAHAELNPMAAMFGGIVGQEVVKAWSGKFHPLYQFFYFDSVESLPTEPLDPSDLKPLTTRYDKKLEDAKVFLVGSGALGCEFLKNLALMGKSNLSRQFLFRDWNIGQEKSTVAAAAAAALSINPQLQTEVLQNCVGPETENVFDDTFWENLSVVINVLDNVNARLYVDQRCLYFQKPLFESGTLSAKCNTQMVIPHLTENYGASRDPPEKQAPMCTLHSFPHNIDHCLTWARSEFEGFLEKIPAEVNAYLSNPNEYASAQINAGDAQARHNLERVLECLDRERCQTFEDCIAWHVSNYFANRVKQLIFTFPEDAMTSSGARFWSAPKRFPHPLQFSSADPSHLHFIMDASILRAETFGIPIPDWVKHPKKLSEAVNNVIVPDFKPREDAEIVTDEKATSLSTAFIDDAAVINELISKLEYSRKYLPPDISMKPIQFEKDDDTNYHMDLTPALASMRARNYGIPEVDTLKAKFIAGRIIPAIATTTAMATGLVFLELYKVLDGGHTLEDYRNTFSNLALPLFSMAEPVPPKVIKDNPTLTELIQWLADKGLNAYNISHGSCFLCNSMFVRHKERMDKKVVDLARDVAKVEISPYRRHLDVVIACEDDDDSDIDIPLVSVYFR